MSGCDEEREYRLEAERLARLPGDVQQKALAAIRGPADDPMVPTDDRETARKRADALERHLRRLNRAKQEL